MKKKIAKRREEMRLQIVRSAASAFRQLGYHETNMNQIADALEMTKGNLYNYFKAKEEILFFCHQYAMGRLLKLLDSVNSSSYPPEVKLRRFMAGFIHLLVDELDGEILALEFKELTGSRLRDVIKMRDKVEKEIRRVIVSGIESGSFRFVDPKLVSFAIFGAINWIPRWFTSRGPSGSVEISDVFVDCFFNGILEKNGKRATR